MRQIYKIIFNYGYTKDYSKEVLKKSLDKYEAYLKMQATFWEELKTIRAQRLSDEKRRLENVMSIAQDNADRKASIEDKKLLNITLLVLVGLFIMKKIKQ
ncbi:hypothetical protein [Capnocytophaga catalasegens]|uniref:hypothetical protein n=1 Tax=Capnocytophaga catalasegens TaxID=1004260 RepID=UPI002231C6DD|nr:hypothetical protein [Capnocytophaga catalasegens]